MKMGNTAAHLYLEKGGIKDWPSFRRYPGFDRTVVNDGGHTLLHSAVQAGTDLSLLWPELSIKSDAPKAPGDANSNEASSSVPSEQAERQLREIGVGPGMIPINGQNGATALRTAVILNRVDAVKLLLGHPNTDPNLANAQGNSALHLAVDWGGKEKIVKLLLAHPRIDLSSKNKDGRTAFDIALQQRPNNWPIIEMLVTHPKIEIDQIRTNFKPIFLLAARKGSPNLIKLLLDIPDTDPKVVDTNGDSALQIAVRSNRCDIVKLLFDHFKTVQSQ